MLQEVSNEMVTENHYSRSGGFTLIQRHDLHYKDGLSDKVYICTLQEYDGGTGTKIYNAIAYYGRRGGSLTRTDLGQFSTFERAHHVMNKQMSAKIKKGYKNVGNWVDESLKSGANGALRPEVVEFIKTQYPVHTFIESPTGNRGQIFGYSENGIGVSIGDKDVEIPYDKIGLYRVV